jgi:hypothetical protein
MKSCNNYEGQGRLSGSKRVLYFLFFTFALKFYLFNVLGQIFPANICQVWAEVMIYITTTNITLFDVMTMYECHLSVSPYEITLAIFLQTFANVNIYIL